MTTSGIRYRKVLVTKVKMKIGLMGKTLQTPSLPGTSPGIVGMQRVMKK